LFEKESLFGPLVGISPIERIDRALDFKITVKYNPKDNKNKKD